MYTREGTIKDLREVLKIKVKALAAEAQIIRMEERRCSLRSNPAKAEYKRLRRTFQKKGWSGEELKEAIRSAKLVRRQTREEYPTRPDPIREQMYLHRVGIVRREARHAHIAYGLILGVDISLLRPKRAKVEWKEVGRLLERYGLIKDAQEVISKLIAKHHGVGELVH